MGMSEREHHIKVLEKLLKETKGTIELYFENKNIDLTKEKEIVETLGYAISSLKTDLKYDLMYEGEETYTKTDMVAMLEELDLQLDEMKIIRPQHNMPKYQIDPYRHGVNDSKKKIQDKINALKEKE